MELFLTWKIEGNTASFDENEAGHCLRVLRKKVGDQIHFMDGKGSLYTGEIATTTKNSFECIIQSTSFIDPPKRQLHLAVAPVKNADRMQWMVEKCTETGTNSFTFLDCRNNERNHLNLDKLRKTSISACKQSKNLYLPQMNPLTKFEKFITVHSNVTEKWIAHCEDLPKNVGFDFNENIKGEIIVLIGPEGDFTPNEITLAIENGYKPLSMGSLRLRTETAALWASIKADISF